MRHVILTVNKLPLNFSGRLTVVLNDREPYIVIRNVILLLILSSNLDPTIAANIALHCWYSAFIPAEYLAAILAIITHFSAQGIHEDSSFAWSLGPEATMSGQVEKTVFTLLGQMALHEYDLHDAARENHRVRCVDLYYSLYNHPTH